MPDYYTIGILALTALVMQLTPGPDMMLVMGRGIGQGFRIAQATVLGIAAAGLIQLPLLAFGISELVAANPRLLDAIRFIGAGYLIYLGFKLVFVNKPANPDLNAVQTSFSRAIADGAIANLMNPKLIVFQLAFLPQFVDVQAGPVWSQLLILGIVMKACGFVVMSTVALSSSAVGRWIEKYPGWRIMQERFVGVILIALGLRLLFDLESGSKPIQA